MESPVIVLNIIRINEQIYAEARAREQPKQQNEQGVVADRQGPCKNLCGIESNHAKPSRRAAVAAAYERAARTSKPSRRCLPFKYHFAWIWNHVGNMLCEK